jgi:Transglycosylase-like domain
VLLAALAVALVPQATAREQRPSRLQHADRAVLFDLLRRIETTRDEAWRWQRVMSRPPTPYSGDVVRIQSVAYRRWVLQLWRQRALEARREALHPPHRRQWLCIYGYENGGYGWSAHTGNGYYGGLQMDLEFQATYGRQYLHRFGTADHWTPLVQMWVAERAFRTRGFEPWPNTARSCGLL